MLKIGFVFAMKEEADAYIKRFGWECKGHYKNHEVYIGEFEGNRVISVISGIGMVNASAATANLISLGANVIVNVGTCGANHSELNIGDVVVPEVFYDGEFDLSAFGHEGKDPYGINTDPTLEGVVDYSCSHFVTERIADGDYIVDMEAYAIACLCDSFHVNFIPVKVVSDNANKDSVKDFEFNLESVMEGTIPVVRDMLAERTEEKELER